MTTKTAAQRSPRETALDLLAAFARFAMAAIWIVAGVTKLGDHVTVTQSIEAYRIFTPEWADVLATLIGPLEVGGGLLLLLGVKLRASGWVSLGVLVLFIIGLASAYVRGLDIDCGCFGSNPAGSAADLLGFIARDIGFVVLTLIIIFRPFKRFAVYP